VTRVIDRAHTHYATVPPVSTVNADGSQSITYLSSQNARATSASVATSSTAAATNLAIASALASSKSPPVAVVVDLFAVWRLLVRRPVARVGHM
jgi:hypothetical protein